MLCSSLANMHTLLQCSSILQPTLIVDMRALQPIISLALHINHIPPKTPTPAHIHHPPHQLRQQCRGAIVCNFFSAASSSTDASDLDFNIIHCTCIHCTRTLSMHKCGIYIHKCCSTLYNLCYMYLHIKSKRS